jgi:multidrug efflux pump
MPSFRSAYRSSTRRRRRQRQRQRAARRAGRDQSAVAVQVRHRPAGRARRHFEFNANAPKGAIESDELHYQIYTNDNARDAGPYRNLIIANRNGATVRLSDVATVLDMQDGATENIRTYGLYNGRPAVFVTVYPAARRQHHRNDRRRQGRIAALKDSIDPKIDLVVNFDRSVTIRASLRQVEQTLLLGRGLRDFGGLHFLEQLSRRAGSRAGGAGVLDRHLRRHVPAGYTLDNFSLMALTIATGFVVDDAIVVMENTTRHIEAGMSRMRAAFSARGKWASPCVSMSLSLVAVFIPFMFAGGIVGRYSANSPSRCRCRF